MKGHDFEHLTAADVHRCRGCGYTVTGSSLLATGNTIDDIKALRCFPTQSDTLDAVRYLMAGLRSGKTSHQDLLRAIHKGIINHQSVYGDVKQVRLGQLEWNLLTKFEPLPAEIYRVRVVQAVSIQGIEIRGRRYVTLADSPLAAAMLPPASAHSVRVVPCKSCGRDTMTGECSECHNRRTLGSLHAPHGSPGIDLRVREYGQMQTPPLPHVAQAEACVCFGTRSRKCRAHKD